MKSISIFLLFIGIILIIQGYYSNLSACPSPKTIIRYVPRTIYEDQMTPGESLTSFYKGMFEDIQSEIR
jgi:hypothetical protein